ncbi:hypothetical protein INT44_000139 [Umbelopsis vinacea]|uniref:Uncharacterized protein n=1 Tax=Umbelopsis vinacea TaxID=44442 RepID=A0A8H7PHW3_9FUNG|nr:hypothetical protein INT44_000139 [Umbelopsis vinacea]
MYLIKAEVKSTNKDDSSLIHGTFVVKAYPVRLTWAAEGRTLVNAQRAQQLKSVTSGAKNYQRNRGFVQFNSLPEPVHKMWLTDTQKIGAGLTAFGTFFMFLGIMMLFDSGLIAIGNILFLSGITAIIGPRSTLLFFMRREKIRGTICFLGGILLVFIKWPFVGIAVEIFGFLNLFGDFFPVIFGFLKRMPVIGTILSHPAISRVLPRESRTRV